LAQEDALECERQIQLLLKNQIIEPSTCVDFNSPLFLVGKKDGTKRMVIDLRGINNLLKPFLVHLPKIPELLEEATLVQGDKLYLSSLDLFSGFFAIKLHKNSRHYTSFTSPATGERYQYQRVPFGLHASPAAMCLCLSNVLRGVLRSRFLCYMDDLLARSGSWEGHLQDLSDLFALLFKNNLRCNPTKCEFGFTSLDFLGFTISRQGIGISKKKTQIIEKIAPPTNRKSLQRILGLLTFFRRHVRGFAQKTANMRKLLNLDDDYKWTKECDQELSYLKERLLSNEVLRPIDPSKDVFIQVDASTEGTGYVVMQRHDGRFYPNYFGGQCLTSAQSRYSSSDLELIALVQAIKSVEWLGMHKTLTIFTDCARCAYLDTWNPLNNRQRRLIAYVLQFKLDVRYIPGCKNYTADALSRCYSEMTHEDRCLFQPDADDHSDFVVAVETRRQKADREATQKAVLENQQVPMNDCIQTTINDSSPGSLDETPTQSQMTQPRMTPCDMLINNTDAEPTQMSPGNEETVSTSLAKGNSSLDVEVKSTELPFRTFKSVSSETELTDLQDCTDSAFNALGSKLTDTDYQ